MGDNGVGFGALLRACREAAGLSQQELAERTGLSIRTLGNLERGRTQWPYRDSLSRLADGLGLRGAARAEFMAVAPRRLGWAAPNTGKAVPRQAETSSGAVHVGSSTGQRVVPRQLPVAVPTFVGRRAELAALSRMLHPTSGTTVITAIGGPAGVGKTALALHWAHLVDADFPDGQLFVNLRGFSPVDPPVTPAEAVRVLLEALDVPAGRLPGTVEAQLGMYRSLLAGRRMLVILDNASDEAQVRPLLPGSPTCRAVITSRNRLTGLAAIEAARLLTLDVLTDAEAAKLLEQRIGADRLAADPYAVQQVIQTCARLPLALSIIAARAAMRPDLPLSQVVAELTACQDLAPFSAGGDAAADVRAALSWSYQELPAEAARAFRLAGLHPGPDLDAYAIAALTGTTLAETGGVLGILARGCLIQPGRRGRYSMHDLLRRYAGELTAAHDSEQERQAGLTRLFEYYLTTAADAMDLVFAAERHRRPRIARPAVQIPAMASENEAREWLGIERPCLVAAAQRAAQDGWHSSYPTRLSATLFRYLDTGGHLAEAITVHGAAVRAAGRSADNAAEASALTNLGSAYLQQGHFESAASHYQRAIALYRQAPDRMGEARAVSNLGLVELQEGCLEQAIMHIENAVALFRDIGDRTGEAGSLANLGIAEHRQGQFTAAMDHVQRALGICREIGDRSSEAHALTIIGTIHLRQGDHRQAVTFHQQALALAREIGDRSREADILANLSLARLQQGHHAAAAHVLQQAMALARESGDLALQAQALNNLGEVYRAQGRPGDAYGRHMAAMEVAAVIGSKLEQARAHYGLGEACHADGDVGKARRHWQEALALYTDLRAPEAEQVRARLEVRASPVSG